ncbi:MAG: CsbD family protein [Acidimicrobiia bacterium]
MGERMDEAKGRMKEAAGKLADDPELERRGKEDRMAGKLKGAVEHGKDKLEEWIDDGKEKMRRE